VGTADYKSYGVGYMTTNRGLIEDLHILSCDERLPQEVRDYMAGACEALDSTQAEPSKVDEGADHSPSFLQGWAAVRREKDASAANDDRASTDARQRSSLA
jgi:hypothetical protein